MSLLNSDPPTCLCRIGNSLGWDTEIDIDTADEVFDISVSFRSILDIFSVINGTLFTDREKNICMLRMFYLDNVPSDHQTAQEMALEFMACGKGMVKSKSTEPCYYSWTQDGDYIYAAINQSFNGILDNDPDLHWWKFVNCFMNIGENCRINEIICNRAAHYKNKATKEQKESRRLYPEIYILREHRKTNTEATDRAKELEKLMNA